MARAEPRLAAGLCLLAAASCGTDDGPAPPAGWERAAIPGCCALHLPPGSRVTALPDPIDNPGFRIEGKGFDGVAYVQASAAAPPIATASASFSTRQLKIDGRRAWLTSYSATEPSSRGQKRVLDWGTGREAGKPGESLHGEFSCEPRACANLETSLQTLVTE